MHEPFSQSWAEAWGAALASSPGFAGASQGFRGAVAFVEVDPDRDGFSRAVAVEIDDGRCTAARTAEIAETESARFALAAAPITWRGILDGSLDPVGAVLSGQVRLTRGSLFTIAPHLGLARELLRAAREVSSPRHGASATF